MELGGVRHGLVADPSLGDAHGVAAGLVHVAHEADVADHGVGIDGGGGGRVGDGDGRVVDRRGGEDVVGRVVGGRAEGNPAVSASAAPSASASRRGTEAEAEAEGSTSRARSSVPRAAAVAMDPRGARAARRVTTRAPVVDPREREDPREARAPATAALDAHAEDAIARVGIPA